MRREKLIKESRDVISLSSKTIVNIHTSNLKEARKLHTEARKRLLELRKIAGVDLVRYLMTPEQEFVESSVMYSLSGKEGNTFPLAAQRAPFILSSGFARCNR